MGQPFFRLDLYPVFFRFGPFLVGYYALLFFAMLVVGGILMIWQLRRTGTSYRTSWALVLGGAVFVIVGARLGHCMFYHVEFYFSNPMEILKIWKGGMSSHGVFIAILIWMSLMNMRHGFQTIDLLDRFSFSASAGAALVRVANFLNAEIVGRKTDVPWGVRFMYYDSGKYVRHPVQLYEAALCVVVFGVLLLVDKMSGKERRPRGLLAGLFGTLYFGGRFFIEFFKEYLTIEPGAPLTKGQYLSIIPFLLGVVLIYRAWKNKGTSCSS